MAFIADILVVGGGGAGGNGQWSGGSNAGGGGGGGGVHQQAGVSFADSTAYSIATGAGGVRAEGTSFYANNGGDTAIYGITGWVTGGGGGARAYAGSEEHGASGYNGGGGGNGGTGGAPTGRYAGGNGGAMGNPKTTGGGGGGFMGPGGAGVGNVGGGAGGGGWYSDYGGGGYMYGAGGGGGGEELPGGAGGDGTWGGAGGAAGVSGGAGPAFGAGGGSGGQGAFAGGAGCRGVVIIRYAGAQRATGGAVTSAGGYTIHTFDGGGTFTTPAAPVAPSISNLDTFTYRQGTVNLYSHVYGAGLIVGTYGVFTPATGCSAPFAAHGGDSLIALHFNIAADAPLGTRTFQVQNPNGTSNGVTVTILPQPPTLTAITTASGGPGIGFVGIKQRMTLTGTNFVAGATVNGTGMTVANVAVVSATQIAFDMTGTVAGAQTVSVTTSGGTTATVGTTLYAPTANAGINPGFIINTIHGPAANTHPGSLGMYFTVGTSDRRVTHLGRWKDSAGTAGKHDIWVRETGSWAIVARAVVDLSVGTAGTWNYTQLPAPVVLKANTQYVLSDMTITSGGDNWMQVSPVAMDGKAVSNGLFVDTAAMFGFTPGANRTDAYGAGFKFTPTGAFVTNAIGRWKNPGNNLAHPVYLKDAAGTIIRSTTIDFTGGKGIDNRFNYGPIVPLQFATGAVYYIVSQEGGDVWTDYPGTISPWGGLTINSAVAETMPIGNKVPDVQSGAANQQWGGVDVLCTTVWPDSTYAQAYVTVNLKWEAAGQPVAMII